MDNQYYFEKASIPRAIAKFAIPTILSQVISLIYTLSDTVFVGHTNDANQIAALALCFPVFMVLNGIGNLFGIGANSLISRCLGARNYRKAKRASSFAFYGAIALTVVTMVILILWMKPIFDVIGASDATYGYAAAYIRWTVIIGGIPTVAQLMLAHFVRSEGNTRIAAFGMSLGGILNVFLDPIFIFGLKMGVGGAGAATALSNCAALVYLAVSLAKLRGKTVISLSPALLRYSGEVAGEVLLVGLPASLVVVLGSSANIVLTHIMSVYGDVAIASYGVNQKLLSMTIQITVGLTQGIMPLIGYNYAAKNAARTKSVNRWSFLIIGIFTVVCLIVLGCFPGFWMQLFTSEPGTVDLGSRFLRIYVLSCPGMCFTMLFNSIFQAMGKWLYSVVLSSVRQGFLLIPLILILNRLKGMYGIVAAQPVADMTVLFVGILLYVLLIRKAFDGETQLPNRAEKECDAKP